MYWPVCDFITYRYVPIPLQVCLSAVYNCTFSPRLIFMALGICEALYFGALFMLLSFCIASPVLLPLRRIWSILEFWNAWQALI
jgi:hypothetical protein